MLTHSAAESLSADTSGAVQPNASSPGENLPDVPLRLLVVDADSQAAGVVRSGCGPEITIFGAGSVPEARRLLQQNQIDVLLLDIALPHNGGLALLDEVTAAYPKIDVVVTTGFATAASAMEAMRAGASDYLTKPISEGELHAVLDRAGQRLRRDLASRRLRERLRTDKGMGPLIGTSPGMERVYRIVSKVALSQHPALILGESGTGKEMVARTIHSIGPSAVNPFVVVDCAAIPAASIESEMFGTAKRGSAGDGRAKTGLLTAAGQGTVFLDEVGELPLEVQSKLLRAIQEKRNRPVGSAAPVPFAARVLAASSGELMARVGQGLFRKDLYFRLNVVKLAIPPLRERREDIPLLSQHFLESVQRECGRSYSLSDEALRLICDYDWPGNVRELQSAVERTIAVSSGPVLHSVDLPTQLQDFRAQLRAGEGGLAGNEDNAHVEPTVVPIAEMEKQAILGTIRQLNGDKLTAAKLLGIGKTTLYRKLKEYGDEC